MKQYDTADGRFTVRIGTWHELGADAAKVRTEVFVEEQGIPIEMEWDAADHSAIHAVAYNSSAQAVATGRLLPSANGTCRIGRMAVTRALRGAHLGQEILQALTRIASSRGDHELVLHAQCTAQGFYAQLGFTPRGELFDEAGIPHVEMFRTFP